MEEQNSIIREFVFQKEFFSDIPQSSAGQNVPCTRSAADIKDQKSFEKKVSPSLCGPAQQHLEKCLLCPRPACTTCPANTQIKDAIKLVREGKQEEAGALLFENNPLSAITGAVCPNHLYCQSSCVLGKKNNAVNFGEIEKEVSGKYLDLLLSSPAAREAHEHKPDETPSPKRRVLIAGSGPAGLSLAYYLRRKGYSVTIYEREEQFGGMLRYGIPWFRLESSVVDKLIKVLKLFGIRFENKKAVDLNNLEAYKIRFDTIVLAIGASTSRGIDIKGENLPHVWNALNYLAVSNQRSLPQFLSSKTAVIIGGGNVAIDCALTAKQNNPGCSVTVCYRRAFEDLKCYPEELQYARDKDVQLEFHMVPKRITKTEVIFERNGKEIKMPAEHVVIAIGQQALKNDEKTAVASKRGFINADKFETNLEKVYALGDAVTGTQTIIKAVAAAKELSSKL